MVSLVEAKNDLVHTILFRKHISPMVMHIYIRNPCFIINVFAAAF